jgi:hypothetical protein
MSLPQTSLGMAKAQHRRSTIYSYERLATVTEKFTEKLNLSSYALFRSDIGASVGFRLAVMHCNFNSLSVTAPLCSARSPYAHKKVQLSRARLT